MSLFVFADARLAPILRQVEAGAWLALTDERCLGEFRRVLAYPQFGLDPHRQAEALARYQAFVTCLADRPAVAAPLPQCRDRDDQKFLELARDGAAALLVTSDKTLLRLARRRRLQGLFAIATPEAALAALTTTA